MKLLPVFTDVISPLGILVQVGFQLLIAIALIAAVVVLTVIILRKRKK